jgi:hypothetical protein
MRIRGALLVFILSFQLNGQTDSVIISEIMFYPVSGNNEFIEIYNLSPVNSINLLNYKIRYYTSTPDSISDAGYGTILPPNSYAVVLEGDYDFNSGIYNNIIPSSALILKITNNSFGTSGMANTTSRPVWLLSPSGDTLDYYFYSADNSVSISDEKKNLVTDTSSVNWANSLITNGTPGFRNSVMMYDNDLSLITFKILPIYPVAGDDLQFLIKVLNKGTDPAENFSIKIFNDLNRDSVPDVQELIYQENISLLSPTDTILINADFSNTAAGKYYFIAVAGYPPDENILNNILFSSITVSAGVGEGRVIINEIMYSPANNEPEWVEIFNNSPDTLNLKKWKIGDAVSSAVITNSNYLLEPGRYVVLAKDSSIQNYYPFNYNLIKVSLPALNNSGDAVVLKDSLNTIADSVYYLPTFGGLNNKSLERRNPSGSSLNENNWGTSINRFRATPGHKNSITDKQNDIIISSFKTDQKYGINGEDVHFSISLRNTGTVSNNEFSLFIYHDINKDSVAADSEEIKRFTVSEIFPGDSLDFSFPFNGYLEGNNSFIARINSLDEDTCNNTSFYSLRGIIVNFGRGDIIINEIMYAPVNEPEWFELFNNSANAVDLKNFRVADGSDTVYLSKSSNLLNPGNYIVIATDSIILQKRNIPSGFIRCSFPPLNNSGDRLIIIDSLMRVIDSIAFNPLWGGMNGLSLERKNNLASSQDSLNWGSSSNKYRGTPGFVNSLSEKEFDLAITELISFPVFPVKGDTVVTGIKIKNKGTSSASFTLNIFRDNNLDSIPDQLIKCTQLFLNGRDSLIYNEADIIPAISSNINAYAEIVFENDQDTSDNYLLKNISFGYPAGSITINEILYSPQNGECEWIEIFNRSGDTINLQNWKIRDLFTTPHTSVIDTSYRLFPFQFLVIAPDTSLKNSHRIIPSDIILCNLPNLNNDKDGVILLDSRNLTIDSMSYTAVAGNRSLEKISISISSVIPQNWGSSMDIELSTPGRINSITPKNHDLAAGGMFISPRFPSSGDTISIKLFVKNPGLSEAFGYNVSIQCEELIFPFSSYQHEFINGSRIPSGDSIIVNCGKNIILNNPVKLSMIIEYPEDEDPINNIYEMKIFPGEKEGSILINEIMYNPPSETGEWVEIFNNSNTAFNLNGWSISDILPSPGKVILTCEDLYINPGDYFIITSDSSFKSCYPDIGNILIAKFGALSSAGDGIILYDYRDGIIDSVKYNPKWGGRNFRSLERISFSKSSADSSNWTTSLSPQKCTPGEINSVTNLPLNTQYSVVINEIMYEPDIDNCEFVELYAKENINIGGWRIEDGSKNYFIISDTTQYLPKESYYVFAADSILFNKYSDIKYSGFAGTSSLGFSNSGELLLLKDINGGTIDSILYSPKYHNRNFLTTKNRSLERINPEINSNDPQNWSTSTNPAGATPG